ncbi:MAG: SH3 domain-containing protein [Bacillota bacterium]|nr:SH3 domain-containing protein [Bacillota bacterium]
MAQVRDLAAALRQEEEPLLRRYEELASAAGTTIERELVQHLMESQEFQLAFLELLLHPLPDTFHCFAKISDEDVKLRDGPGAGHGVVGVLRYGTPCLWIDAVGLWVQVQLPSGSRGYVFKDYVTCERGGEGRPSRR